MRHGGRVAGPRRKTMILRIRNRVRKLITRRDVVTLCILHLVHRSRTSNVAGSIHGHRHSIGGRYRARHRVAHDVVMLW